MSVEENIQEEIPEENKGEGINEPCLPAGKPSILPNHKEVDLEMIYQNLKIINNDMEVHHHPHVAKKNFKEYFLEFIMIFLTVSLGYFAENLRESSQY